MYYNIFLPLVPTCEIPGNGTLIGGHVNVSTSQTGNRLIQNDSVTVSCDTGLIHPNGQTSRQFVCSGLDTFLPALTVCSCMYVYLAFYWTLCLHMKHIWEKNFRIWVLVDANLTYLQWPFKVRLFLTDQDHRWPFCQKEKNYHCDPRNMDNHRNATQKNHKRGLGGEGPPKKIRPWTFHLQWSVC